MLSQAQPRTILQRPWRIAALVAVFANVTFNIVNGRIGTPGATVADVSHRYPTLFTPAGFAFAIWGLIYVATIIYSLSTLTQSQLEVRLHDRIAPWLVAANVLSSLWIVAFTTERFSLSMLLIASILVCTMNMYRIASDHVLSEHLSHFWRLPFGLWMSWLGVATLANLCLTLSAAGVAAWPLSAAIGTSGLLVFAGFSAVAISAVFLDPVVAFVVSWATAAIAVEHWQESSLVAVVAALVSVKTLLMGARLLTFGGLPWSRAERERLEHEVRFEPARAKV